MFQGALPLNTQSLGDSNQRLADPPGNLATAQGDQGGQANADMSQGGERRLGAETSVKRTEGVLSASITRGGGKRVVGHPSEAKKVPGKRIARKSHGERPAFGARDFTTPALC